MVALLLATLILDVPYVPQTDVLCGGAAVAMVQRYWGDAHADVRPFEVLVDRKAGGIAGGVLAEAVRNRGWRADSSNSSLAGIRHHLDAGQPQIVLLAERNSRYHYVVVIGLSDRDVIVHDPSRGPSRTLSLSDFEQRWRASGFWSLTILPLTERPLAAGPAIASIGPGESRCDRMLDQAVSTIRTDGLESAEAILDGVRTSCPAQAGPLRELAGVRFEQRRWDEADALARQALALDPKDAYALDILGSSRFMRGDDAGALGAWNQLGKPSLDSVDIKGLHRTRYRSVTDALDLQTNRLLTADALARASRRLNELPDQSSTRLSLRPGADGFATVDVVVAERPALPRTWSGWTGVAARAAIDREAALSVPGFNGEGEVWSASWRWANNRPKGALALASPGLGGLAGVWRVEGSWESQEDDAGKGAASIPRESHAQAALAVSDWLSGSVRYSLHGGIDVRNTDRRAVATGASIERRWFTDRVLVSADATKWFPVSAGSGFHTAGIHAGISAPAAARVWAYNVDASVEHVGDDAPMGLWPGAGDGHVRAPLLRAHPLEMDGVIDVSPGSVFGRTLTYATAEVRRWLERPRLARLAVATFIDVARADRSLNAGDAQQVDAGIGLRVRVPGMGSILRVDYGHGLRDGQNAVTLGLVYQR